MGEFLLASASYPQYATGHIYSHHAVVGTPMDLGAAPKGQSIWNYFPREVASNLTGAWRVERERLARRALPIWHYTNPFWRYEPPRLSRRLHLVRRGVSGNPAPYFRRVFFSV